MKQIEKDLIVINAIGALASQVGIKLEEQIKGFDIEKVKTLTVNTFPDSQFADALLIEFASESYNRIKKKFPQS